MATCTQAVVTPASTNTPNISGTFTPAASDLLVTIVAAGNSLTPAAGELTSSDGLTFHLAGFIDYPPSATNLLAIYVANQLANAVSQTVTFTPADVANSAIIGVLRVAGMSRTGSAAVRQVASRTVNVATNDTPDATFAAACLTGNVIIGAVGNGSDPAGLTPPTNYTEAADSGTTTPTIGLEYAFRNSGETGTNVAWGVSVTNWGVVLVELDTTAAAPVITDVDTDESITGTQSNVVITGTGFGAAQGAGHVKVFDGSLSVTPTIDAWADTSIQFDMSIGTSTGIRYGARTLRVTDNAAAFDEQAITVTAPATVNYVDLTTLADPADRLTSSPDMESGDQLEWSNVVGGTIADVTVYPDGSFSFAAAVTAFDFRVHNVTEGWGAIATQSTAGLVPTITTTTLPNGTVAAQYEEGVAATGDVPITYSISAGSLPAGLSVGSTDGVIIGAPTTAGLYSFTAQATNSFGNDTQALSITVNTAPSIASRRSRSRGFVKPAKK